jgi:hypothetical protein
LFKAGSNQVLFIGDFAAAELRTLGAVCKARFGHSQLANVIAEGVDPHAFTAAAILGMSLEQFMKLKETEPKRFKEARQSAKALNFGIPGGLGIDSLVSYARSNYDVAITPEDAKQFRDFLITKIYPELNSRDGYLADEGMAALARNLGLTEREVWAAFDWRGERSSIVVRGVSNVIRGSSTASERYQKSVWNGLSRLIQPFRTSLDPEICKMIAGRQGSEKLHEALYKNHAATLTGRLRAGVGYTEGKNTPFQSLCADGAKLALWKLLNAGFDVYAFVHDEILVRVKREGAEMAATNIRQIMEQAMEEVIGHGVPALCEYCLAECWEKP